MSSDDPKFESRKKDHITQSLNMANQVGISPSDQIMLFHKALPELNFDEVSLSVTALKNIKLSSPIFVSSMTAGHEQGEKINHTLARACDEKKWLFAVGSQRKELTSLGQDDEWKSILSEFPNLNLSGNVGLTQLISFGAQKMLRLIENLKAKAMFIHCNPLQEVLQSEGTPQFRNGLKALKELCELSTVPIIIKETGCGFDKDTLIQLMQIPNLYAVDIAGFGGTHWGRIEGHRNSANVNSSLNTNELKKNEMLIKASQTYSNWGLSTADSLVYFNELSLNSSFKTKIWASGGIRNGLDVVTCISMGAEMVGLAQPILMHALKGYDSLIQYMQLLEFETKIGLFCTGFKDINSCQKDAKWERKR